jgi:hypothetical protein
MFFASKYAGLNRSLGNARREWSDVHPAALAGYDGDLRGVACACDDERKTERGRANGRPASPENLHGFESILVCPVPGF